MPQADLQSILFAQDNQAQVRNEISAFAINLAINRTPLVTRVPRVPVGSQVFSIVSRNYRGRTAVLAAAVTAAGAGATSTFTLDDVSKFMNGDVLELQAAASGTLGGKERVEIQGDPAVATNTVTVKRGAENTTPVANDLSGGGTTLTLIGNSRTGGEVNQNGVAYNPAGIPQYCQTFQHPVQVSGALASSTAFVLPAGAANIMSMLKFEAMQNLMDDMEKSSLYGLGEAPTGSPTINRPKQKGLRTLLQAGGNVVTAPTNAAAYKPSDLIRDALQTARQNGGDPDVLLCSWGLMGGLVTWASPAQRVMAGSNVFGTPIDVFEAPFLNGLQIVPDYHLQGNTCVALTSGEVRMRMKRNEFWNPRGVRGDAEEGDFMAEGAIEVGNPQHHAWVEGITAFSAT